MDFNIEGVTPTELQKRFVIGEKAPFVSKFSEKEDSSDVYDFYHELDGIALGHIELRLKYTKVGWYHFYPLSKHATPQQLSQWYGKEFRSRKEFLHLAAENRTDVIPELQRKHLGTLSHVLIFRWLVEHLTNPEIYVTEYISSVSDSLRIMISKLEIEEMITEPQSLVEMSEKITRNASQLYGFEFND